MSFELVQAEEVYETKEFLETKVTVNVTLGGERINGVGARVGFKKENNSYSIQNNTDWMARYDINSSLLGEMILQHLEK